MLQRDVEKGFAGDPTGLPNGWKKYTWIDPTNQEQKVFYWNSYTEEPSWEMPSTADDPTLLLRQTGWTEKTDPNRNRRYFWNKKTGQSTWNWPLKNNINI